MRYKDIPPITEKQGEIMRLVYQFRFINRHQLLHVMNHKNPRRLNAWLKDIFDTRIWIHIKETQYTP